MKACLLCSSVPHFFFLSQEVLLSNYHTKLKVVHQYLKVKGPPLICGFNLPLGTCPVEARWLQEGGGGVRLSHKEKECVHSNSKTSR